MTSNDRLTIVDFTPEHCAVWQKDEHSLRSRYSTLNRDSPEASEYVITDVELAHLASSIGRLSVFNSIADHQEYQGVNPEFQVWQGIEGIGLIKEGKLISDMNTNVREGIHHSFFATNWEHWRSIIGEAKYSPFTYIHKAYERGANRFPTIIGYGIQKLEGTYTQDEENIQWSPRQGETVAGAVQNIYYLGGLFPRQ